MHSKQTYGKFDKFLHWVMALNIIATLVFARGMSGLPGDAKLIEYGDHGLSVTTIALLLIIRIAWRMKEGFPVFPATMRRIEIIGARLMHYGLYIALACQILIGVLLASTTDQAFIANGYNIDYSSFGLIADHYHDRLLSLHIALYWLIVGLLIFHVMAALKHHVVDRDNVLRRMLPLVRANGGQ
ncbi:MAG: cytochrome b [Caldilineaceae bacterium]|nr:cytochrome b [Caldilineaceae bacterium]